MAQNMHSDLNSKRSNASSGKFHWLFVGKRPDFSSTYNTIILETEHFAVVPSLGSLVAGWLIIVPKFPVARIADLGCEVRDEFEALVDRCLDKVEAEFGKAFVFEHGGKEGSRISCGVDQAHLHIVPLEFDLLNVAIRTTEGPSLSVDEFALPYDVCGPNEYWYVSNQKRTVAIAAAEAESQWFRKLIAQQTGQSQKWNYNEHPFHQHVDVTLKVLGVDG
jgi:diadenosine tetraphosphate (Ap4A) HIT family hydrolase